MAKTSSLESIGAELIQKSYHREIMEYLCANPSMGKAPLSGTNVKSNCHGTTLYILQMHYPGERLYFFKEPWSIFLKNGRKPGYFNPIQMEILLGAMLPTVEMLADSAITFWTGKNPGKKGLIHSGIFLGELGGVPYMFHQRDYGGVFEVTPVNSFEKELPKRHSKPKRLWYNLQN